MSGSYESLVYGEKRALQSWKSAVAPLVRRFDPAVEDLVWEALVLFGEYLRDPSSELEQDISRTAYELAQKALETRGLKSAVELYRDALVQALSNQISIDGKEKALCLIRFSNLIGDAFNQCYVDSLKKTIRTQRTETLSGQLRLAKQIQQHLLPKSIPKIPGYDFAGRLIPAAEVGGDYWSIKHYPEDGVVTLKLADITGHGIAAATLVAAVKFISGGQYHTAPNAAYVMDKTNRVLVKETPTEILVSMVYAWLYPETREISIVNAGHEPVFICKKEVCADIAPTGPVMGVTETTYGEIRFTLEPGDVICFASDGITEAGTVEPFGMARLRTLVAGMKDRSADEIADGVIDAVNKYAGRSHDDLSILIIKVVEP